MEAKSYALKYRILKYLGKAQFPGEITNSQVITSFFALKQSPQVMQEVQCLV